MRMRKQLLIAMALIALPGLGDVLSAMPATPEYSIQAIRYATSPDAPVSELVVGGPKDEKVEVEILRPPG